MSSSRVTPWLAAAMRVRPRLVASARMVASSAFSLSQLSPVRRLVKAAANPVARFVSCRISVMRARGSMPSSLRENARACVGVLAVVAAICSCPSRSSTPSSFPCSRLVAKLFNLWSSSCPRAASHSSAVAGRLKSFAIAGTAATGSK